ncbi:hypothetical protein [Celeribacter sp.]|uniref:hypothetical protein n=1 Tax=Celeribacter sp. TaxID=1890673 RepID=UPI003A91E872
MTLLNSTKWHLAMRVVLFFGTANATRLAIYDSFIVLLGQQTTVTIIFLMSVLAALFGPMFRKSWPASAIHMYWASMLTGLVAATTCLALLTPFQTEGITGIVDILASAFSGAISGAVLVVIALLTKPLALLSWAIGTLIIGYCARRVVYWSAKERGDDTSGPYGMSGYNAIAPFRWW